MRYQRTRGTVVAVHPQRQSLDLLPDDRSGALALGQPTLDRGLLDHGYPVTAHKAQRAHLRCRVRPHRRGRLPGVGAYVALSRGRHDNHLCVLDEDAHDEAHTHPTTLEPDQRESLDELTARLERVARQRLDVDHLDDQTRAIIDGVVSAAQQRQRIHQRRPELDGGPSTER